MQLTKKSDQGITLDFSLPEVYALRACLVLMNDEYATDEEKDFHIDLLNAVEEYLIYRDR